LQAVLAEKLEQEAEVRGPDATHCEPWVGIEVAESRHIQQDLVEQRRAAAVQELDVAKRAADVHAARTGQQAIGYLPGHRLRRDRSGEQSDGEQAWNRGFLGFPRHFRWVHPAPASGRSRVLPY